MKASPYVNFQGRAREAMEFYHGLFGGSLELLTVDEKGPRSAAAGDRVMMARLDADGVTIVGTDGHPKYAPTAGDNWAIAVRGSDHGRLHRIFDGLAEGGRVKGKLAKGPFGTEDGYLEDKFGVGWIVNIEG